MGKTSLLSRSKQFEGEGITIDKRSNKESLMCTYCGVPLVNNKSQIQQHIETAKHKSNKLLKFKQKTISSMKGENEFGKDICRVFVGCNIPLNKLNNVRMKMFMEKYTGRRLPSESTIRKNYRESMYMETVENIRKEIGDNPIWASIDETTDVEGRYIANVIVGALREECASRPYLIHSAHLEHTDAQTICETLNEAFIILWPDGIKHNRVLLLVTDAAAYMKKAGKNLGESSLYQNAPRYLFCPRTT